LAQTLLNSLPAARHGGLLVDAHRASIHARRQGQGPAESANRGRTPEGDIRVAVRVDM
jgi:hypothetical protein